jgi:hypothetical protein
MRTRKPMNITQFATPTRRGIFHLPARRSLLAVAAVLMFVGVPLVMSLDSVASASSVALSESNNGKVVAIAKGSHFSVTLHTTYWSIHTVSNHVVTQIGKTVVKGSLGNACAPGQGCGTVTATYVANKVGTVRLTASRTTCGEALKCSTSQSHWTVVVRVK